MIRALLLAGALAWTPALAAVGVTEIEEGLTCQCGCGLTVHSCPHLQCGSGIPLKQEAAELVSQGLDKEEIFARFREKYGEKILSSPVPEGFNLTAWILPFAVVLAGGGVVFGALRRWSGRKPSAPRVELSDEERRAIDDEVRRGL